MKRRHFLQSGLAAAAVAGLPRVARPAGLDRLSLDYAYYSPLSLILKKFGWLDQELKPFGTAVEWVLSLGSNKANQFLASGAVQLGSTAGSAALLARANGSPIRTVYLYSQPEWTAIVIPKDSNLKTVRDLRGKKIAATKGTDPWFFLLRSLHDAGFTQADVEIVELQHPDGRLALERGQVDAWAGLDPHMAASQLDAGSRLLYRNIGYNTFGALNAREDFIASYPQVARAALRAYERARIWALAHLDESAAILAEASNVEQRVAELVIRERTHFPEPVPGAAYRRALDGVVDIIRAEKLALPSADLDRAVASLADPTIAKEAVASG